jgi:hypothetical protein
MRIRFLQLTILIVLVSLFLSACGGAPSSSQMGAVETIAAATFQAMIGQAEVPQATNTPPAASVATNTPGATVLSPASPATIYPKGSFVPYSAAQCEALRSEFEKAIGAPVVLETTPFSDRVTGGTGTACRVHGAGTGATYTMDIFSTLVSLLPTLGWTEDGINYGAGGPTGMATGFTKGGALGLLSVRWQPSSDANCPKDQPISMCVLTPEQKLYDVTFDVADKVVYNPPTANDCNLWLPAIQPALPVAAVLETVNFTDFEMFTGTACQVRAIGNGLNFANMGDTAQAIDAILISLGWTLVNGADGPTGTGSEYTNGNLVAVVFIKWTPAPGVNCPQNQPISACPLTPEQKLYTVTVALAQK